MSHGYLRDHDATVGRRKGQEKGDEFLVVVRPFFSFFFYYTNVYLQMNKLGVRHRRHVSTQA